MSDGQTLLLILCVLYLSDCLIWVGKRTVAFVAPWCRRWHVTFANPLMGNAYGGLVFLNPIPPFGSVMLSHLSPVSISPAGVCAYNLQSLPGVGRPIQTGNSIAFANIAESGTDGPYLLVNKARFAKCATSNQAQMLADLIKAAAAEPPDKREILIRDFMDRQFARQEAQATISVASDLAVDTRWVCGFFFLFLFCIVPVLVEAYGLNRLVMPVAGVMVISALYLSFSFFRAHKALFHSLNREWISHIVKMILCPPVAIRAADLITVNAVSRFHPVLVSTILPASDRESFVRFVVRDLKYPVRHELTDLEAIGIASWYTGLQLDSCIKFLRDHEAPSLNSLFAPPTRDGACTLYCPRCGCQYMAASSDCPDCPGVELVGFPTPNGVETSG